MVTLDTAHFDGVFEKEEKQSYSSYSSRSEQDMDLAVASNVGYVNPGVVREEEYSRNNINRLVLTDRVYEYLLKQFVLPLRLMVFI